MTKLIAITGSPGAGKTTVAQGIYDKMNIDTTNLVSVGDLVRNAIAQGMSNEWMALGNLAPEKQVRSMVLDEIVHSFNEGRDIILDGMPRTKDQVTWLKKVTKRFSIELHVVYITAQESVSMERMNARKRDGDEFAEIRLAKSMNQLAQTLAKALTDTNCEVYGSENHTAEEIAYDIVYKLRLY